MQAVITHLLHHRIDFALTYGEGVAVFTLQAVWAIAHFGYEPVVIVTPVGTAIQITVPLDDN